MKHNDLIISLRFVASTEAGCSDSHKHEVTTATFDDTIRTLVISGRPLRVKANDYIKKWEERPDEIKKLLDKGITPFEKDMDDGVDFDFPHLMGQVAAVIDDIKPAGDIVNEMVEGAVQMLQVGQAYMVGNGNAVGRNAKL